MLFGLLCVELSELKSDSVDKITEPDYGTLNHCKVVQVHTPVSVTDYTVCVDLPGTVNKSH